MVRDRLPRHPHRGYDDRGWLKVIDRNGTVRTLAGEFWGAEGVAWSPDGRMIYVSTSAQDATGYHPHVVNVDGEPNLRPAFPSMTSAEVMDVAPDGRLLVSAGEQRFSIRVQLPGEPTERELPWLELPVPTDLSADGKGCCSPTSRECRTELRGRLAANRWLTGRAAGRRIRGRAVTGRALGHRIRVEPGAEPLRGLPDRSGTADAPRLLTGDRGRRPCVFSRRPTLLCGSEPKKPRRCYRRDLAGGQAEAATPENVPTGSPAPDGRTIVIRTTAGDRQVVEVGGGPPRAVPGYQPGDRLVGWSRDSRALFVQAGNDLPAPLDRIELARGTRTRVRDVMPPDRLGLMQVVLAGVSHDGQAYPYMYWRQASRAIVVNGLKRQ